MRQRVNLFLRFFWALFVRHIELRFIPRLSRGARRVACLRLPRLDYSRHFITLKDRVNWMMISNEEQLKIVVLWYFFFLFGYAAGAKKKLYKLLLRYVKRLKSQTSFLRLNYWQYFFVIDRVLISAILNLDFIFLRKKKRAFIESVKLVLSEGNSRNLSR